MTAEPAPAADRILPEYALVTDGELSEAVHQALGAASVCWQPMDCTGVFDGTRAVQIADELLHIVDQYAQAHADGLLAAPGDGQWMRIAFMGHVELDGYVTEITLGGQPAFHVDLPEKLWGGNPLAWQEYAATALYSRRPVTEASVRKAWDAERARRAVWEERQTRHAITTAAAAADDGDGYDWPDYGDGERS